MSLVYSIDIISKHDIDVIEVIACHLFHGNQVIDFIRYAVM